MGKASWNIVWAQLIGYAVVSAILSYLASLIMPNPFNTLGSTTLNPIMTQLIHWGLTLGLTPLIILSFFIGTGIRYLIAKAFTWAGNLFGSVLHWSALQRTTGYSKCPSLSGAFAR